jgi:hypothetical protein
MLFCIASNCAANLVEMSVSITPGAPRTGPLTELHCIPGAHVHQITSCCCINGQFRGLLKPFIEDLKNEPLLEPVVWAKTQQLLVSISCLAERFSSSLSEICNLSTNDRNFRWRKYLERKTSNIWGHVLIVPVSNDLSQFLALSPKEKK